MRHLLRILVLVLSLTAQARAAAPGINGEWTICGRDWSLKRAYIPAATVSIDEASGTITLPKGLFDKTRYRSVTEAELAGGKEVRRYTLSGEDAWRRAVRANGPAGPGPLTILRVHDSTLLLRSGNNERIPHILLRQGAKFTSPNTKITGRWVFSVPGYVRHFGDAPPIATPPFVIVFDLDKRTETAFAVLEPGTPPHAPETTQLKRDKAAGKGVGNELRLRLFDIFYRFIWLDKDLVFFHLIHPSSTGGGFFILRRVTPETTGGVVPEDPSSQSDNGTKTSVNASRMRTAPVVPSTCDIFSLNARCTPGREMAVASPVSQASTSSVIPPRQTPVAAVWRQGLQLRS